MNTQNTTSQAAATLGSISTEAKARAARENGKKGGRPPRSVIAMLWKNEDGGWCLSSWKGDDIPTKNFKTQAEALALAAKRNWGVKRIKSCDSV